MDGACQRILGKLLGCRGRRSLPRQLEAIQPALIEYPRIVPPSAGHGCIATFADTADSRYRSAQGESRYALARRREHGKPLDMHRVDAARPRRSCV
jgi:hypothetical protein